MLESKIIWNPILASIRENLEEGEYLKLIASPFIKLDALKLLMKLPYANDLSVIVRWGPADLLAGVSDLEIYPYLQELDIPLYINPDIHLKMFLFNSGYAYCGSGNVTCSGLGLSKKGNIEMGHIGFFSLDDHVQARKICDSSRRVTDEIYETYWKYLDRTPSTKTKAPPINLPPEVETKEFLISCLPASRSPDELYSVYKNFEGAGGEDRIKAISDMCNYGLEQNLDQETFYQALEESFIQSQFVISIVDEIRKERSMRFGAVNEFIHRKCEDVPLPYRWELKERTNQLYNWLCHFHEDLDWDIPGSRSQVIFVK